MEVRLDNFILSFDCLLFVFKFKNFVKFQNIARVNISYEYKSLSTVLRGCFMCALCNIMFILINCLFAIGFAIYIFILPHNLPYLDLFPVTGVLPL